LAITAVVMLAGCGGRSRALGPIRLTVFETLGSDGGVGALAVAPTVSAPLHDGRRVVIASSAGIIAAPTLFGPSGAVVGSLADADGGPPAAPRFARIGPGDSVWVFDAGIGARVYDSGGHLRRRITLPSAPWDAVVLADSRIVLSRANAMQPLPLILVAANGDSSAVIGGDSAAALIAAPRWIARGRDGSFWTMPTQFRWQLEHWDSVGHRIATFNDPPPWFAGYETPTSASATVAPQPLVNGLWVDPAGRIWILGQVADPHWATGLGHDGAQHATIQDADKTYDTVIEVIDPTTGHAVASTRVDQWYAAVVEPGVLLRIVDTRSGWRQAILTRVTWSAGADRQ
jgi:hypothetical protein